jgi:hypothetical protein
MWPWAKSPRKRELKSSEFRFEIQPPAHLPTLGFELTVVVKNLSCKKERTLNRHQMRRKLQNWSQITNLWKQGSSMIWCSEHSGPSCKKLPTWQRKGLGKAPKVLNQLTKAHTLFYLSFWRDFRKLGCQCSPCKRYKFHERRKKHGSGRRIAREALCAGCGYQIWNRLRPKKTKTKIGAY